MVATVLGVGVGLFILLLLWSVTFLLCLLDSRLKKGFGVVALVISSVITIILLAIPRQDTVKETQDTKIVDPLFICRVTVTLISGIFSVVAIVFMLVGHWAEPILAQSRKRIHIPIKLAVADGPTLWTKILRVMAHKKNFSQSKSLSKVYAVKDVDEFEDKVILNPRPVIVNFHADWCEPCHILTPKLEEMVSNSRSVDLVNLNCDDHVELLETFEVKAVPAIIAFKGGAVVDKFVGLVDARQISTFVQQLDSEL